MSDTYCSKGSIVADCDGTQMLRFGSEKSINSTLFAAVRNNENLSVILYLSQNTTFWKKKLGKVSVITCIFYLFIFFF